MPNIISIALIPLLPLAGFILLGLFGKKSLKNMAGLIGTVLMATSFLLALQTAFDYFTIFGNTGSGFTAQVPLSVEWLPFATGYSINLGLLLDPISSMMLVVVTLISLMVHIYSLGYMKGEERYGIYYAYLSLFTFSMLGLVLSSNLFQIYIFWELVGVSSFLLIGFYFTKPSAVAASKKAFIVTRFADLGFLMGILILSSSAGTLDFQQLIATLTTEGSVPLQKAQQTIFLGASTLSWGLALVFIGGAGKSALFPLHIWLPDAMEGPTPVSALIHAATMVVAGVYLVARLFPVYAISAPDLLEGIAWVGAFSAVFAAIIACTQTDIKRVLAYSTMSQIGFMLFALGVSKYGGEQGLGFTASMFHLFTHAIFKALLFLGAGAVIHYVHSNEMKDMGGLVRQLPITHLTFLIACLAIAGVPPFAGFFSKEEILLAAYQHTPAIYWIALLTSGLTAFYMFRLYFSIFWNKPFVAAHGNEHQGEGGVFMMTPLLILAAGAITAGFIPFGLYVSSDGQPLATELHLAFSIAPIALGIGGILLAFVLYRKASETPDKISNSLGILYRSAYHKFYIDEAYLFITHQIVFKWVGRPLAWFDRNVIDGAVNLTGHGTELLSASIKKLQSGKVQFYAFAFLATILIFAVLFLYVWR
jgi:NADH-quinone oxidoreductase subunit L